MGFSCGSAGKESACNVGDQGLIPGLRRSLGEGKGYPLQYSGLENSMGCIVHGVAKNQTLLCDFHFTIMSDWPSESLNLASRKGWDSAISLVFSHCLADSDILSQVSTSKSRDNEIFFWFWKILLKFSWVTILYYLRCTMQCSIVSYIILFKVATKIIAVSICSSVYSCLRVQEIII